MRLRFYPIFIIIFCLFNLNCAKSQTTELTSVFLEELTWTEVKAFIDNGGKSIIIPTGGTEQNGPHMVLGKHNFRVEYMAGKIANELGDALVAPMIAFVPEGNINPADDWMIYPGTISLPEEHFIKLLEYTCRSLKQHGFIDILLIGDSGGNQNGMKIVSERLNNEWKDSDTRVHFVSDYYGKPYNQVTDSLIASGISQDDLGFHGGVIDVSFLLAVDSSLIRIDKLSNNDWSSAKKSEMGFSGDLSKVDIEIGKLMIQKTMEISLLQVEKLKIDSRK
ncbi:MAG: creatininase family protein [Prolixibacteraceae bacterium]|jgi:creatinine amidohydrolase|nr:creatininase family protein [Prolixibacteraceae bacterium]